MIIFVWKENHVYRPISNERYLSNNIVAYYYLFKC